MEALVDRKRCLLSTERFGGICGRIGGGQSLTHVAPSRSKQILVGVIQCYIVLLVVLLQVLAGFYHDPMNHPRGTPSFVHYLTHPAPVRALALGILEGFQPSIWSFDRVMLVP